MHLVVLYQYILCALSGAVSIRIQCIEWCCSYTNTVQCVMLVASALAGLWAVIWEDVGLLFDEGVYCAHVLCTVYCFILRMFICGGIYTRVSVGGITDSLSHTAETWFSRKLGVSEQKNLFF